MFLQFIFNDEKLRYNYSNNRIAIREYGNVHSHDQEESKLNSAINTNLHMTK